MQKWYLTILFFLFFFLCLSRLSIASQNQFIKSSFNPVYTGSTFGSWNEVGIYQPSALIDGDIKLWYASFNGQTFDIAYATSANGLNWNSNGPIYNEPNRASHSPNLIKDNGKYILAYTSSLGGASDFKVKLIQSNNGLNFETNSLQTISSTNSWAQGDMSAPLLWKENNVYYLFYAGRNGSPWKLGLAYSADLISWTHCPNPMFDDAGDGTLIKHQNQYTLYYHMVDASGIVARTSSDSISCNMTWSQPEYVLTPGATYDINHMSAPSIINKDGILYMYYSGLNSQNKWTLNLATDQPLPVLTPSPTPTNSPMPSPTLTPTQTPSPTPTPTIIPKVYVVPGLFGSWNKEAILHQQAVPQSDWKLIPIFHEIEGLLTTFQNLGYIRDNNLITFAYDWRQPIDQSVDQLHAVIESYKDSPDDTFQIVGHSLGGLIARIYAQKYPSENLKQVVTVGSPHLGTANAYKAVEAGEVEYENTSFYLGQQALLQLYKTSPFQSNRDVMNDNIPVLNDLLPTYPYLKKTNQTFIPLTSMIVKNNYLTSYNTNIADTYSILHTNGGVNLPTLFGYQVTPPTTLDSIRGIYPDGRPISNIDNSGDGVVLKSSALTGNNKTEFNNQNHGDIWAKKPAIKKMLDGLNIDYQESDIVAGEQTMTNPALLLFIQSPATMQVVFNGTTYEENEGMIYIPNAQSGSYLLKVTGVDNGDYTVTVGQMGTTSDYWTKIKGKITKVPASSQVDSYPIIFDPTSPEPKSITQGSLLEQFLLSLDKIVADNPSQGSIVKQIKSNTQSVFKSKSSLPQFAYLTKLMTVLDPLIVQAVKTTGQTQMNYLDSINLFQKLTSSSVSDQPLYFLNLKLHFQIADQLTHLKLKKVNSLSQSKKDLFKLTQEMIDSAHQYEQTSPNYTYILLQTAQKILALL